MRDASSSQSAENPSVAALRQLTSSYRALFEYSPLPMWVYDRQSLRFLDVNSEALRVYGYSLEEFMAMTLLDIRPAEDAERLKQLHETPQLPFRRVGEWRHRKKDGSTISVEVTANEIEWNGRQAFVAIVSDVTERKAAEHTAKTSQHHLAKVQELAELSTWEVDLHTGRLRWSDGMFRIFGLSPDQIPATAGAMFEFIHPDDRELVRQLRATLKTSRDPLEAEFRLVRRDGSIRWIRAKAEAMFDETGARVEQMGTMLDITDRKDAEEQLAYLTSHDEITGLPNRALLLDRLHQAVVQANRTGTQAAVLSLHIDNLSTVADTGGHSVLDSVVGEVAGRLRGSLREGDTLARPGGDEFLIAVPALTRPDAVADTAQSLLAAVSSPVVRGDKSYFLTASIGISLYPSDDTHIGHLVRDANAAASQVKAAGGNGFRFFTPEIHSEALRRLSIEGGLRSAIVGNHFELFYQPVVDSSSKIMVGTEALLRWQNPSLGTIAPMAFIPVAEATGLIVPIGSWVLRQGFMDARKWQRVGQENIGVAVNVAPRQLQQPDFPEIVAQVIGDTGIAPDQVILEITESTLAREGDSNRIRFLADLGVRFAIDDFGTGYSSLGYLRRFPIYSLKIDKSFVDGIETDSSSRSITEAIIALASKLGYRTVAEGVETAEQARILTDLGCTMLQGYYFGRPMPLAALLLLIEASEPSPLPSA